MLIPPYYRIAISHFDNNDTLPLPYMQIKLFPIVQPVLTGGASIREKEVNILNNHFANMPVLGITHLNFYNNRSNCARLICSLITPHLFSFYCAQIFTIAYSCYFFVTSPKKTGFALWQTPSYHHFII